MNEFSTVIAGSKVYLIASVEVVAATELTLLLSSLPWLFLLTAVADDDDDVA